MMYTVVGFWRDTKQRFTESIDYDDSYLAEISVGNSNPGLTIVAILEGECEVADNETLIKEF